MANQKIPGLSEKITAELKNRKITKKRLCEVSGFSMCTLKTIIDTSRISADHLAALADALDVSVDYLTNEKAKAEQKTSYKKCKLFKCPSTGEDKCCFYCDVRDVCINCCLNKPQICNSHG